MFGEKKKTFGNNGAVLELSQLIAKKRPFLASCFRSRAGMVRAASLTKVIAHRATYGGWLPHGWPATARVSIYGADRVAACVCYDVTGADDCVGIRAT